MEILLYQGSCITPGQISSSGASDQNGSDRDRLALLDRHNKTSNSCSLLMMIERDLAAISGKMSGHIEISYGCMQFIKQLEMAAKYQF